MTKSCLIVTLKLLLNFNEQDMMKEFLTYEDCNVIRVDWGAGSKIPYTQVFFVY